MTVALDEAIARAERAATELAEARAAGADCDKLELRCAALGLTLLAEMGASALDAYVTPPAYDMPYPGVMVHERYVDVALLRQRDQLLRRLGWFVPAIRDAWAQVEYDAQALKQRTMRELRERRNDDADGDT